MADQIKFNLPKVRIRIKTEPIQLPDTKEPQSFKQYQASPLVFQERQKMKKQIQQSYLRFRRMKKNNYLKQTSSHKKHHSCHEQKKLSTISVKDKNEQSKKSIQIVLETEQHIRKDTLSFKTNKQRQKLFSTLAQDKPISNREMLTQSNVSCRHPSLIKCASLHQSCLQLDEDLSIELQGKKCNYSPLKVRKNRLIDFKTNKKGAHLLKVKINKMSTFQIDPWKDNTSQMQYYLQDENF